MQCYACPAAMILSAPKIPAPASRYGSNRPDQPEHIVRLTGQVIRLNLDTIEIINSFPPLFA